MIGVDIVVIDRIKKMMERFGNKALEKFLSSSEIKMVKTPSNAAGLWAAKEAASKALGSGIGADCGFHDIVVFKDTKNAPHIEFSQDIQKQYGMKNSSVSITHDGGFAIAVVAIEVNNG